jgi:hypothetical protein
VLSYFNELWNNRTEIDTAELFTYMPPSETDAPNTAREARATLET